MHLGFEAKPASQLFTGMAGKTG